MRVSVVLGLVLLCLVPCAVRADLLIVPVTRRDDQLEEILRLTVAVNEALDARAVPRIDPNEARKKFEDRHSREPVVATEAEFALVAAESRQAIDAATSDEALEHFGRLRSIVDRIRETLGRNADIRESVLQACSAGIRQTVAKSDHLAGQKIATWCVHTLQLDYDVEQLKVPATVRRVLKQAWDALEATGVERITINVLHPDVEGCVLIIDGIAQGPCAPVFEDGHPRAREVLVSTESVSGPGRVHAVLPSATQRTVVTIDPVLDSAVRTDRSGVRLQYPDLTSADPRTHASDVLRVLNVQSALLLERVGARFVLRVVSQDGVGRSVQIGNPYTAFELEAGLAALFSDEYMNAKERSLHARNQPDEARIDETSQLFANDDPKVVHRWRWPSVVAGAAVALGASSLIASGILTAKRNAAGARFRRVSIDDGSYALRLKEWDDLRPTQYGFAVAGSVALTAGVVGWLTSTKAELPSWVSIVAGLAGMGAVAWGISDVARGRACDDHELDPRVCVNRVSRRDRGAVVLLSALPLLAVPVVQLLRTFFGRQARADFKVQSRMYAMQRSIFLDARIEWF